MYMACTPNDSDFIRVLKQLVAVDFTDWFTNVAWSPSVTYCIVFLCLAFFFCYWLQHNFTQFLCRLFWKSNIIIKLHYQKVLLPFRVKISVKIQNKTPLNEPNKQIRGQKINQLVTFANLSINLPDFKICQSISWSDSQKVRQTVI